MSKLRYFISPLVFGLKDKVLVSHPELFILGRTFSDTSKRWPTLSNISFRLPVGKNTGEEVVDRENMSEDDESNLPDAVTAQKLVHEFEGITNTDEALAQFYLQVEKNTLKLL